MFFSRAAIFFGAILLIVGKADAQKRVWQDNTGNFAVVAELITIEQDRIQLRRASDDSLIWVSMGRLSKQDQQFVWRTQLWQPRANPKPVAPPTATVKPKQPIPLTRPPAAKSRRAAKSRPAAEPRETKTANHLVPAAFGRPNVQLVDGVDAAPSINDSSSSENNSVAEAVAELMGPLSAPPSPAPSSPEAYSQEPPSPTPTGSGIAATPAKFSRPSLATKLAPLADMSDDELIEGLRISAKLEWSEANNLDADLERGSKDLLLQFEIAGRFADSISKIGFVRIDGSNDRSRSRLILKTVPPGTPDACAEWVRSERPLPNGDGNAMESILLRLPVTRSATAGFDRSASSGTLKIFVDTARQEFFHPQHQNCIADNTPVTGKQRVATDGDLAGSKYAGRSS